MDPHPDLTNGVIHSLGWLYLILFFGNAAWTLRSVKRDGEFHSLLGFQHLPKAFLWASYTGMLLLVAITHITYSGSAEDFLLRLPLWFKNIVDLVIANPISYFALSIVAFWACSRAA